MWRFFLENNKASSVLTALGVRVQKSMEQDTGSAMIPRFLKAVWKFDFLICGSWRHNEIIKYHEREIDPVSEDKNSRHQHTF